MDSPAPRPARRWNTPSTRILLGLLIGLAAGAWFGRTPGPGLDGAIAVAAPIGQLWLDALTMTVVPLVFGLLVTGVATASDDVGHGGVAARAGAWFMVLLVGACAMGAATAAGILGWLPPPAGAQALTGQAQPPAVDAPGEWFKGLIPANPLKAAVEMAMAPLVVFALFFGFAANRIAPELRLSLIRFFEAVVATMLVIVGWVLLAGPVGVLALGFVVGARLGVGVAGALAHYVMVASAACLAVAALAYLLAPVIGRLSPVAFARAALPVQAVALGTQSSLACLPAMVEASRAMAVGPRASGVVLPLAVSVFRMASAAANIAVAVYLAHLHGVSLSLPVVAIGVLVAAAVSLAAVGLPAQVSFFATIAPVCLAMGVPIEVLPLLLAVETIPDIFRTLGNVTWDLAVTRIVGRPPAARQAV